MTYFTIKGKVLSEQDYLEMIGDAPLITRNGNLHKRVKILSNSPQSNFYFPGGLVQIPELDVQPGDVVQLAYHGKQYSAKLVDWMIEK